MKTIGSAMTRTLSSCAAFLLLLSLPLQAQRGADASLDVEVGDVFEYEEVKQTHVEAKDPLTGSPRIINKEIVGLSLLEVADISDDLITWKMSIAMQQTDEEGEANSVAGGKTIPFEMNMITDRRGKMKEMNLAGEQMGLPGEDAISAVLSGSGGGAEGGGLFIPENLTTRNVGEHWSTTATDTAAVTIMAGMMMDIVTSTTTTFTYGGRLDTLGVSAARLHWRIDTMKLSGSVAVPNTEMTIAMNGGGTGSGTAYYSLADGMLLSKTDEMTILQTVEMGGMGSQSMKMTTSSEQTRQD